ncbi:MAG: hypothetical protein IPO21_07070 [Bacteroidales bacterium]|nr:hypothetical protein [Bacteroidales bacterium]
MSEITYGTRVKHDHYGEGIVSKVELTSYEIFFETKGRFSISKNSDLLEVIEYNPTNQTSSSGVSLNQMEELLCYVLDKYNALTYTVDLGKKWEGGTLLLQPANKDLKPKEIPIEVFFHKIVMLRDKLRVLEQQINSHEILNDQDKINLQQYITKIYGSLTTFNILFDSKEDFFVGQKS